MAEEDYVFAAVTNIPSSFHVADLRAHFSSLIESRSFISFHFRHRPEKISENTPETDKLSDRKRCCVVQVLKTRSAELLRYNGQHWTNVNGDSVSDECQVSLIKLKSNSDPEGIEEKKLLQMPELKPPELMPHGNVGTPTLVFLDLIQRCLLPHNLVSKLQLRFPKTCTSRIYGNVNFDYSTAASSCDSVVSIDDRSSYSRRPNVVEKSPIDKKVSHILEHKKLSVNLHEESSQFVQTDDLRDETEEPTVGTMESRLQTEESRAETIQSGLETEEPTATRMETEEPTKGTVESRLETWKPRTSTMQSGVETEEPKIKNTLTEISFHESASKGNKLSTSNTATCNINGLSFISQHHCESSQQPASETSTSNTTTCSPHRLSSISPQPCETTSATGSDPDSSDSDPASHSIQQLTECKLSTCMASHDKFVKPVTPPVGEKSQKLTNRERRKVKRKESCHTRKLMAEGIEERLIAIERRYQNDEDAEEWDRCEASEDDPSNQERNKERLYDEEIEQPWEKGGPGVVFYTDAMFWQEKDGDFDEQTTDDLDVDFSAYEEKGAGDKDIKDFIRICQEKRFRDGYDKTDRFSIGIGKRLPQLPSNRGPRIGQFESHSKGVGRKVMEKQGWKEGQGLGRSRLGIVEALKGEGQSSHDKRGLGYTDTKPILYGAGNTKKPRTESHLITTIYDDPNTTDPKELLLQRSEPSTLKHRQSHTQRFLS